MSGCRDAKKNKLVVVPVGILYQDAKWAHEHAPEVQRDGPQRRIAPSCWARHHDTGEPIPFRETSTSRTVQHHAEMATQWNAGTPPWGMSLIAPHNGGGTASARPLTRLRIGAGRLRAGGHHLKMSMPWDTMIGVSAATGPQPQLHTTVPSYNEMYAGQDHITMPYIAYDAIVAEPSRA